MITIGIILIILAVLIILAAIIIVYDESVETGIGSILLALFLGFIGIMMINSYIINLENKCKPKVYKIDLPEEISLAKTNDILYINKITKDSIYLGFKPNK